MVPILVIDDVNEDLLLAQRVIRQAGLTNPVHLYREATELLSYFDRSAPDAEPVLMLIDLVMFPQNGVDILGLLKTYPLARRSVSVMLTGLGDMRQIQRAYHAGATTFLIKPFALQDLNQFLSAFNKHFCIRGTAGGKRLEWSSATAQTTANSQVALSGRTFETAVKRNEPTHPSSFLKKGEG